MSLRRKLVVLHRCVHFYNQNGNSIQQPVGDCELTRLFNEYLKCSGVVGVNGRHLEHISIVSPRVIVAMEADISLQKVQGSRA